MKALIRIKLVVLTIFLVYHIYNQLSPSETSSTIWSNSSKVTIEEVLNDPYSFKEPIVLSGAVEENINILGIRYYKLADIDDKTAKLLVIPRSSTIPKKGTILEIEGQLEQMLKFGDIEWVVFKAYD